jgi:heat-inducible transcriptional repressor
MIMNKHDKKYNRRLEVLRELVESYIKEYAPVSSDRICRNLNMSVSAATVRNTLSELDELEWTTQPHSSSGRVPSWKAYRAYVDTLKKSDFSIKNYTKSFEDGLDGFEMSYLDIVPALQRMTSIISEISGYCGMALSPRFENDFIRQIKLVPLDFSRFLVALISDFGLVTTEIMQMNRKIGFFSQKRIEDYLNERLQGASDASEPPAVIYDEEEKKAADEVYNEIVLKYLINLRPQKSSEIFIEGIGRLFNDPEMQTPKAMQSVIEFFENRDDITGIMRNAVKSEGVYVRISEEIKTGGSGKSGFSLIAAPYEVGSLNVGAVGILGSMRMNYRELMPLVGQAADFLTKRMALSFRKPRLAFDRDIPFKVMQG